MMAASARTSGTSWPSSSILKRGVCTSRASRARASDRARASRARRAREPLAEYDRLVFVDVGLVTLFLAVGVLDCVTGGRVDRPLCASAVVAAKRFAGRPRASTTVRDAPRTTNL